MDFKISKKEPVFVFVKDEQKKIRIAMGNSVISQKKFENYKQAEEYVANKPYELIFNGAMVVAQWTMKGEIKNETQKTELEENQKNS